MRDWHHGNFKGQRTLGATQVASDDPTERDALRFTQIFVRPFIWKWWFGVPKAKCNLLYRMFPSHLPLAPSPAWGRGKHTHQQKDKRLPHPTELFSYFFEFILFLACLFARVVTKSLKSEKWGRILSPSYSRMQSAGVFTVEGCISDLHRLFSLPDVLLYWTYVANSRCWSMYTGAPSYFQSWMEWIKLSHSLIRALFP